MKLFVCNRSTDRVATEGVVRDLLLASTNFISVQQETEHSSNWKTLVENKMQESDFVLFVLGNDTFQSEQIKWEFSKAQNLSKRIVAIRLSNVSEDSLFYCRGFQIFTDAAQCLPFLTKTCEDDRQLKIEQYKMMVSSTEKVTESRLKVNNLFFTITSTILSICLVLGKSFDFSIAAVVGMIVLTILSLAVSYFWEKLVKSYGKLNAGKFMVIDKIEKQLRTNMFEDEWQILTKELKYEPNTTTETKVIVYFRTFIIVLGVIELIYLGYLLIQLVPKFYI